MKCVGTSIVITLVGNDRTGIVESVSRIIADHGGEWVESRMANLSGKFSGLLLARLPDEQVTACMKRLETELADLQCRFQRIGGERRIDGTSYRIQLLGHDRPGIVHRLTKTLVGCGATVDDMETDVVHASMSGERLFKASFLIRMTGGADPDALKEALEAVSNELMVDIELE